MAETQDNKGTMHWLFGAALLLIGVFVVVALVMVNSQAASVGVTASVTNSASVVVSQNYTSAAEVTAADGDDAWVATGLVLSAGGTVPMNINGTITDSNGIADVTGVTAVFYSTDAVGGSGCTANDLDCYASTCDISNTSGTDTIYYNCANSIQYWAESTDVGGTIAGSWDSLVTVTQVDTSTVTDARIGAGATDVNTLSALTLPTTLVFPVSVPANASTTAANNSNAYTGTQQGNDVMTTQVSSTLMTCTIGSIPLANLEWVMTDLAYGSGTTLTGTAQASTMNIGLNTTATDQTDEFYLNANVPNATGGTCSGTLTVNGLAV